MERKQSWFARLFAWAGASRAKAGAEPAPRRADWSKGQILLDDFEVEGVLGAGGMGVVYLVRSRTSGARFAVKTILTPQLGNADSQRHFLAELQTWIDLPEHPHCAACRFCRTIDERIAIFAEYVDGGSLADWVRDRKLRRLEQILDVAIQFAWGLHAAHEHGIVHQDVKPANVLMTRGGSAKVSDFGLAKAARNLQANDSGSARPVVVSVGGMTPAYCSPEQAAGRPLTRQTDIWSWALSVVEMLNGGVTWQAGPAAPDVLENLVAAGPADTELPVVRLDVAEILRKCFRENPAERWTTLAEVGEALCSVYRQALGHDYPRPAPVARPQAERGAIAPDDRRNLEFGGGHSWSDPRLWLREALQADGRNPDEAAAFLQARGSSRQAQTVGDLAAYEEAERLFQQMIARGRTDLELRLALLRFHKALVHSRLHDAPGAVATLDKTIALCERLVQQENRLELAGALLELFISKGAYVETHVGDHHSALLAYDKAIAGGERLLNQPALQGSLRRSVEVNLVSAQVNKANALSKRGDMTTALTLYDQAISRCERWSRLDGAPDSRHILASAYRNKARCLCELGDYPATERLCGKAIALYEELVKTNGRREFEAEPRWPTRTSALP